MEVRILSGVFNGFCYGEYSDEVLDIEILFYGVTHLTSFMKVLGKDKKHAS